MKRPAILALGSALVLALVVAIVAIFRPPATEPPPDRPDRAEVGERSGTAGIGEPMDLLAQPKPAPEVTFATGEGEEITLSDFQGKVVLLNFWATWCAPCVEEMPTLDKLQADLGGEGFQVVALSSDRAGLEVVEPFYAEHGLSNLAIYIDPKSEAGRAFGIRGMPTTVLIDREGREVARKEGQAEWDTPEIKELIRRVMDG